jgi:hypothetical protein
LSQAHTGEPGRFPKDLRKGLETRALEAYRAQIRALDDKRAQSRAEAKALLEQQAAAYVADYEAIRQSAEAASRLATDLAKQACDAEGEVTRKACAIKAASAREHAQEKARLEREKRLTREQLTADLRRLRREGADAGSRVQAAEHARDQHAAKLAEVVTALDTLDRKHRTSLLDQLAIVHHDYEAIRVQADQALKESKRLDRQERKAHAAAKKKLAALEVKAARDAKREDASAQREKKDAERALQAEMRQIEASTRERTPGRKRAPTKTRSSDRDKPAARPARNAVLARLSELNAIRVQLGGEPVQATKGMSLAWLDSEIRSLSKSLPGRFTTKAPKPRPLGVVGAYRKLAKAPHADVAFADLRPVSGLSRAEFDEEVRSLRLAGKVDVFTIDNFRGRRPEDIDAELVLGMTAYHALSFK